MKGIQKLEGTFKVVGVKPGFMNHEEEGKGSAFEDIDQNSFSGKWKIIYFYPKDFTFVCPTEIAEFASLNEDFEDRDAVLLGGSTDNEHCKLAWRRAHDDLKELNHWSLLIQRVLLSICLALDQKRSCIESYFIIDPHNVIQHASVNNLDVGRNPKDTLRIF